MTCASTKNGFTLLEMLVASLLLGMLVTILTMVFNSSSVAWRTGKAGMAQMSKARHQLALIQRTSENALPRIHPTKKQMVGEVLSPWDDDGNIRERAVRELKTAKLESLYAFPSWDSLNSAGGSVPRPWVLVGNLDDLKAGNAVSFTVGVHSWGPDGKKDTADDINTWPADLDE